MAKRLSVYEIDEKYRKLLSLLEGDECDFDALMLEVEQTQDELKVKIENIVSFLRNLELHSSNIETEIKRLEKNKKSVDNRISSMKKWLTGLFQSLKIQKLQTNRFSLSYRSYKPKVVILDEDKVPSQFKENKITEVIKKADIMAFLKESGIDKTEYAKIEVSNGVQIR